MKLKSIKNDQNAFAQGSAVGILILLAYIE